MIDVFTLAFAAPLFAFFGYELRALVERRRRRAIDWARYPATPYRGLPGVDESDLLVPGRGMTSTREHPAPTWKLHPLLKPRPGLLDYCPFCRGTMSGDAAVLKNPILERAALCHGRKGGLWRRPVCPQMRAHHHVRCRSCNRSWLEAAASDPAEGESA